MRIVVAMSGGVDSSVAASLLAEEGYDVVGLSMQLYDNRDGAPSFRSCCTPDDLNDARRVAERLGIPHYIVNFEQRFDRQVVSHFVSEYVSGRTPIPCVQCNSSLKFTSLLERARGLDAEQVATGHYARVDIKADSDGKPFRRLRRAVDRSKDQSYFLFSLTQEQLACAYFPLGKLHKSDVRNHARACGLDVADKPDSHEICFVPDGNYAALVERRPPNVCKPGRIVDTAGHSVGYHTGIHRFTVGQRKGLGISSPIPLYVTNLDPSTNTVVVGSRKTLDQTTLTASRVNWIAHTPELGANVAAQIRHHHPAASARIWANDNATLRLEFDSPQRAIAPGQAVVVYDGDVVLGGGWID